MHCMLSLHRTKLLSIRNQSCNQYTEAILIAGRTTPLKNFYAFKKILFLFCFLYLCNFTKAQTIKSINIEGNSKFSRSDYIEWMGINTGMLLSPGLEDSLGIRIGTGLQNSGYFNYSLNSIGAILSPDSQQVNINIDLNEGKPSVINNIVVDSLNSRDSTIILDELHFLKGRIFNKSQIENAFEGIIDNYEDSGFPFASITIHSIIVEKDSADSPVDIYLSFSKGDKSIIDRIEIIGNDKTKDIVILRAARLFPPVTYSQERIDNIQSRLNRLNYFQTVGKPVFYYNSENKGILQLTVKEKTTNSFDGIVGYVPGDEETDGYFTGYVNIGFRNLFGTGRLLTFTWQKEESSTQELAVSYKEPWILGYPFNILVGFSQRKQDSTYVQRDFESSLEYLATEDISASFLFSLGSIIPTENEDSSFSVYNSSSVTTGAQLEVDTRDDLYSPTQGIYFSTVYKYSSKTINGPERFITADTKTKFSLKRFELDLLYYLSPFTRQVLFSGIHGREIRGELLEISDLYKLGGTNTLRGYRENQFLGNRTFWSNSEYRYLLTPRSFAFLFFDTGYYLRDADLENNIIESSAFKYGYGLGLNIETGIGILGVSFALGQGDSFSEGKIHFGLVNEF